MLKPRPEKPLRIVDAREPPRDQDGAEGRGELEAVREFGYE